jgi:2-polyprenyl-3-methyl-5-hydroxy-6-metoxy-1,4-benzoquinol methylase
MTERDKGAEEREIEFFATYYAQDACHPTGVRLKSQRELKSILKVAPRSSLGRVLSVGCGDGDFERMLAPHATSVVAIDISPEAIDIANKQTSAAGISNVEFRCLSAFDLEWDERFDTIVCLAFLHHVPTEEFSRLLSHVYEHLNPGGFCYSQDPNIHGVLRKIGRVVLGANYDSYHSPDERELDAEELRTTLRAVGFAEVQIIPIDLTLIPALYMLAKRPGWPLYLCALVDRLWCASPFAKWASGFAAVARKA